MKIGGKSLLPDFWQIFMTDFQQIFLTDFF
jgi:hypothetical protein